MDNPANGLSEKSNAAGAPPALLPYRGELARKALHLIALVIPAGMLLLPRSTGIAILVLLALMAAAADLFRARSAGFGRWIDSAFGFMMRASERGSVPTRRFNGATWVIISAALLLIVFPARIAAAGMTMAMIGDAAAALIGRPWGRHRWPGGSRTVEGSLGFVAFGMLSGLLFSGIPLAWRFAAVVTAAAVELIPARVNDNLLLPFSASAVLWALTL